MLQVNLTDETNLSELVALLENYQQGNPTSALSMYFLTFCSLPMGYTEKHPAYQAGLFYF